MNDNKLIGCLGFLVGAVAVVVVGWMSFELLIGLLAGLRGEGLGAFTDPLLLHEAGELLVVGFTILGLYVWVFKTAGLARYVAATRYAFWLGAACNAVAFLVLPTSRWAMWSGLLVVLGVVAPLMFARLSSPADRSAV